MVFDLAALPVHGDPGEIAHMLVGAGELVEQGGLSAVLVACQGKGQLGSLGQGILIRLYMVFAPLAQAGVGPGFGMRHWLAGLPYPLPGFRGTDLDLLRVRQPEGQLISVDAQLHGVAHGGVFNEGDLRAGDHAHVQKVLAQGTLPTHRRDHRGGTQLQIFQCHCCFGHGCFGSSFLAVTPGWPSASWWTGPVDCGSTPRRRGGSRPWPRCCKCPPAEAGGRTASPAGPLRSGR